jgi:glycosyltransferase involved in cell wall biosynthesis
MLPDIAILSPLARNPGRSHGGITAVVGALADGLIEHGARVELLTLTTPDPHTPYAPAAGLHALGQGHRWQQARRLSRYLDERRPGALLAAGHRANLLAARQVGGPSRLVLSVHNAIRPGLTRLNPVRRWARVQGLRRWYPRADAIVCVSDGVAAELAALAPATKHRLRTLHNPILARDSDGEQPLHPWLSDRARPVVLAAGRLTTQKRFDVLIHAFAQLRHRPAPRLVILGEGAEASALQRLAAQLGVGDRVALPGFVPNPRAHMAAAAVFVLSSAWEGFGNVLVEAMGMGTPVVATDCPSGPREILREGALGPLVPVGDSAALANGIEQMLTAPTASARLQARAADFAPTRVAARYLELLLPQQRAG